MQGYWLYNDGQIYWGFNIWWPEKGGFGKSASAAVRCLRLKMRIRWYKRNH